MTTKTENKNELASPISFGTALGFGASAFFGPAGAVLGFVVGVGLGFWFDKKENNSTKSSGEAVAENRAENQPVINCNH